MQVDAVIAQLLLSFEPLESVVSSSQVASIYHHKLSLELLIINLGDVLAVAEFRARKALLCGFGEVLRLAYFSIRLITFKQQVGGL